MVNQRLYVVVSVRLSAPCLKDISHSHTSNSECAHGCSNWFWWGDPLLSRMLHLRRRDSTFICGLHHLGAVGRAWVLWYISAGVIAYLWELNCSFVIILQCSVYLSMWLWSFISAVVIIHWWRCDLVWVWLSFGLRVCESWLFMDVIVHWCG